MQLAGQHAIIYGGGGAIGGAVARAFTREGATVHLAGRIPATLEAVAADIRSAGGPPRQPRSTRSTRRPSMRTPMRWPPARDRSTSPST